MENVTNQYSSASSMPPPPQQPALPTDCSQALSFGSAEELLALLQSQLASETSLECLISDPSSSSAAAISSSGYSGTNIPSGFAISDDNLVGSDGAASISLFSDGIDMQEYAGGNGASGQLCGMFFLPEPVPSMPVFAPVGELPDSGAGVVCRERSVQWGSSAAAGNRVQLHSFLQDAARMAFPAGSKQRPPQGSSSLPKMRSSHSLETVERGSRSLGSLQANDGGTRGFSNSRSSNDPLAKLSPKGFRTPQVNVRLRTLLF